MKIISINFVLFSYSVLFFFPCCANRQDEFNISQHDKTNHMNNNMEKDSIYLKKFNGLYIRHIENDGLDRILPIENKKIKEIYDLILKFLYDNSNKTNLSIKNLQNTLLLPIYRISFTVDNKRSPGKIDLYFDDNDSSYVFLKNPDILMVFHVFLPEENVQVHIFNSIFTAKINDVDFLFSEIKRKIEQ